MTMRDAPNQAARQALVGALQTTVPDFVRNSRGANRLTRPIDLVRNWTYVTGVRLQRNHLVWREAERIHVGDWWVLDGAIARRAILISQNAEKKNRGILDEFLRLRDASDQAILDYARTWGVLELCAHNLPARHEFAIHRALRLPSPLAARSSPHVPNPANLRACLPMRREPLSTWRSFSAQCKALLSIAGDLQRSRAGREVDWNNLLRPGIHPGPSVAAEKLCLRDAVDGWLQLGYIKPTVDDVSGALTWTGADLFGELAVQVALAVNALDGPSLLHCLWQTVPAKETRHTTWLQLLPRSTVSEASRCSTGATISQPQVFIGWRDWATTSVSQRISRKN